MGYNGTSTSSTTLANVTDELDGFWDWLTSGGSDASNNAYDGVVEDGDLTPVEDVTINGVLTALVLNGAACVVLLTIYEILRRVMPSVYNSVSEQVAINTLRSHRLDDTLVGISTSMFPLWIVRVLRVPWTQVREVAGLDAYMYLRFIRMCARITLVSSFWALLVLFPVFATGSGNAVGWYHYSMSNVLQSDWRIWPPTIFMYMFSAFVLWVMRNEYRHYLAQRMEFLSGRLREIHPQQQYSIMVEIIPKELRSDKALFDYFNALYPGRVHSACVVLNLPQLEIESARRKRKVRRLEKSLAWYEASGGQRPKHVVGRCRIACCGIESDVHYRCCGLSSETVTWDEFSTNPPQKGDLVDSIAYYTLEVEEANDTMVKEQQKQKALAELGNQDLSNCETWIDRMMNIASAAASSVMGPPGDPFFTQQQSSEDNDDTNEDDENNGNNNNNRIHSAAGGMIPSNAALRPISIPPPPLPHPSSSTGTKRQKYVIRYGATEDNKGTTTTTRIRRRSSTDSSGGGGGGAHSFIGPTPSPSRLSSIREDEHERRASSNISTSVPHVHSSRSVDATPAAGVGGSSLIVRTFSSSPTASDPDTALPASPPRNSQEDDDDNNKEESQQQNIVESNTSTSFRTFGSSRSNEDDTMNLSASLMDPQQQPSSSKSSSSRRILFPNLVKKVMKLRSNSNDSTADLEDDDFHGGNGARGSTSFNSTSNWQMMQEELLDPNLLWEGDEGDDDAVERERGLLMVIVGRLGWDFIKDMADTASSRLDVLFDNVLGTTMSSTGFVTFKDLTTVTSAASAPLSYAPGVLQCAIAPEPRDIVWKNAHRDKRVCEERETIASFLVGFGALLWSVPLALIQAMATADSLAKIPGMQWILANESVSSFVNGYLPVVALLTLILVLPFVFTLIASNYEHRKFQSDVQHSVFKRYFYYQIANIYVSVTAGSIFKSLQQIFEHPYNALIILGKELPTVAGYFISLLITKILAGLPMVLLRFGALSRMVFLKIFFREETLTQRELDEVYRELPIMYGWEYPTQLLVIMICFTYAAISPMILPFGACYFLFALVVYKKQAMFVYTPTFESGGTLFPSACDRTISGLILGQLTFLGYCLIRRGRIQPILLIPLPLITIHVMKYFQRHYGDPGKYLSLEMARKIDLNPTVCVTKEFDKDAYRQPVLAEGVAAPMAYRRIPRAPRSYEYGAPPVVQQALDDAVSFDTEGNTNTTGRQSQYNNINKDNNATTRTVSEASAESGLLT